MAVGRISGPLLKANLLRRGLVEPGEENLAFETDLLYLDVVNSRVGVKTTSPTHDLTINGTARTTYLETTNRADIASFTFLSNTISSTNSTINLAPSGANPVIYQAKLVVDQLTISANTIQTTGTNTNLEITPTGTGVVHVNSNMLVSGDLHATGTITADGNIQFGNQSSDTVTFTGEVNTNILPSVTGTYSLGSTDLRWKNLYVDTANITTANVGTLTTTSIQTANLDISGNTISAFTPNTDINFSTNGTGGVIFGNFKFSDNTITNIVPNSVTRFTETGTGYVKFAGTNGIVLPAGNATTERPGLAFTEVGMVRFNTDSSYIEVYNGIGWVNAAGSGGVSQSGATDIGVVMALMLG